MSSLCRVNMGSDMEIRVKRIYQPPEQADGYRLLVDRLWPRGVSTKRAYIDAWMKEAGPSTKLRRWFGHDRSRWLEFKRRYHTELDANQTLVNQMLSIANNHPLTLLYSARDPNHNQAVALAEYLATRRFRLGVPKCDRQCSRCKLFGDPQTIDNELI